MQQPLTQLESRLACDAIVGDLLGKFCGYITQDATTGRTTADSVLGFCAHYGVSLTQPIDTQPR